MKAGKDLRTKLMPGPAWMMALALVFLLMGATVYAEDGTGGKTPELAVSEIALEVLADPTLTVDLSGTWNKAITVELWTSDGATRLWGYGNQHGGVRTYAVTAGTYDVKLVQGPKVLVVDDLDCSADCSVGDVTADLKVDLSGGWNKDITVQLKTDGGDLIWSKGNQHGAEQHYNVLKNTYDLTLVQGPKTLDVPDIGCTGEACDAGDVAEALTVDLSGGWNKDITVELYVNDGDLIWSKGNQHGDVRTYNVLKNTYDLKLVQGAKTLDVADINCDGGTCDAGDVTADLKVDLSGGWNKDITVQLKTDGGELIWSVGNQHGAERHYNVLKNTYDLTLVQGPKTLDVPDIGCTGEACDAGDVAEALTVDLSGGWNKDITVELYVNDGDLIWSKGNQHGDARTYNVLKNTYDLKLVQGAKTLDVADINCDGGSCDAGDVIADLAVDLSGSWKSSITVQLHKDDGAAGTAGALIWSKGNQHGALRHYNVLKNHYDVALQYAGNTYLWDAVDCTGETCTLDKSGLVVEFPGIKSVHTYVYASNGVAGTVSGSPVASQTYKSDQAVFSNLDNGVYDVKVVKNAKVLILDDVVVLGSNANAGDIVATLTVKFPGISSVHTYVKVNDGAAGSATGGAVDQSTYKNEETSLAVLKNHYDVVVVKNAKTKIIDAVDCTGETCTVEGIVATLTVKFPGISSVHTYVKVDDGAAGTATGGAVDQRTYKNEETSLAVLKNTYDVVVVKNAKQKVIDAVNCTGDTCTVEDIVATLTVKFPGISSVHTYVKLNDGVAGTASGAAVDERTYKNEETSLAVLKNTYDVLVVKNAKQKVIDAVDCTGDTCTVEDIVATLTVKFPGISSVHTYVKVDDGAAGTATGGAVDQRTYKNEETSLAVLKNTYDVLVVKNAKQKVIDAVDCTGDTCTVENIVATLTVKFPGMKSVHTYVKVNDGVAGTATGGAVDQRTYKNDETSLPVLKNYYDVVLKHGGDTYLWDAVDCTGDTCTLDKSTLTVDFPGISSVHTYVYASNGVAGTVSGSPVASQTYKNNQAVFSNLDNGVYDVKVVKNAKVLIIDDVVVLGSVNAGDIVATLTVKFPGISSVQTYVRVNDGAAGSATGGAVDERTYKNDETSLAVLKNHYDVVVVKNAKQKIIDAVDCTGETCTVEGIVATLTVKFPGISSVHTYVKVDDGAAGTAAGGAVDERTYKNEETSLAVLKNTYDVVVVKNAKQKVIDAVDCTGDTCTVEDIVATLTVKFPGISSVHTYVKLNDGVAGTAGGGAVDQRAYQNDETSLVVLKNTYDVVVVKNAKTNIYDAVDCTADTCTVEDIVATLTVNFPGINSVHTYVKVDDGVAGTAAGGAVDQRAYQNNQTSLAVLKNTYDLSINLGASGIDIVDAVDCTGNVCWVQLLHLVDHNYDMLTAPTTWDPYGLAGGTAEPAFGGSWGSQCAGQTNAKGRLWCAMTRSDYTKFRMTYNQGSVEQLVAALDLTKYTWETDPLTIQLVDHAGTGLPGGVVDQGGGFWDYNKCTTDASGNCYLEVFPGPGAGKQYKFRMNYNYTSEQKLVNVTPGGAALQFQTGQVFGSCITQYSTGSWRAFTDGMELMPGTYTFKSPSQQGTVTAGGITNLTCP